MSVPCACCGFPSRGIAFKGEQYCSTRCSILGSGHNLDLDRALWAAGKRGGAFLVEEAGQTDMAKLTREEWLDFLRRLWYETTHDLHRQAESQYAEEPDRE